MSASSSDEGAAEATNKPDESVEGLMSSDIVNCEELDYSTYIEGVSILEEDSDHAEVVDETLRGHASILETADSALDGTLAAAAVEAPDESGENGTDFVSEESVHDSGSGSECPAANQLVNADVDENADEDDDLDDISSIFNVSHEEVVGGDDDDEDDGGDEHDSSLVKGLSEFQGVPTDFHLSPSIQNSTHNRTPKDHRDCDVHCQIEKAKDPSCIDDTIITDHVHDADDARNNNDVDDENSSASNPTSLSPSSRLNDSPRSSIVPSTSPRLNTDDNQDEDGHFQRIGRVFMVDEDENALDQFPGTSNPIDSNNGQSDRLNETATSTSDDKQHRPSETDENTPPNMWGISEVFSRLQQHSQQQSQQQQPQLSQPQQQRHKSTSRVGDEGLDPLEDVFEGEGGGIGDAEMEDMDDEKENEYGENQNPSPSSSSSTSECSGNGAGPKNHHNALQVLCENTSLKRKREATSLASPSPSTSSSRDHRRLLESRCLSAWKDVKTEIKEKFVRWSPENPHFNDLTANSLASDAFDDAGLIAQDYMGAIKPVIPRVVEPSKPKGKRRRVEDAQSIMELVSDEILLGIFKWLPKLALSRVMRVCRRFQRVACDESLWHHYDFGDRIVKPGQLGILLSRGVQSLRLMRAELQGDSVFPKDSSFNCGMKKTDFDPPQDAALAGTRAVAEVEAPKGKGENGTDLIPKESVYNGGSGSERAAANNLVNSGVKTDCYPPQLAFKVQHLDLSMIVVEQQQLVADLLARTTKVSHLSLERCSLPASTLRLLAEMKNLSVLNLSTCSDVGGDGHGLNSDSIIPILTNCRLTTLNLAWVGFAPTCLRQVVLHLPPSLIHLNLSGNRNTLVDEDLQLLADKCPLLEVLDVSDSHLLSVESVALLCKGFPLMTHLSISRCYGLQPPSILLPLAGHSALSKLDVFGIMSGEALTQFSKHFRREVELNRCYFSYVARPTPWDPPKMKNKGGGGDLTQIWGVKTNDERL